MRFFPTKFYPALTPTTEWNQESWLPQVMQEELELVASAFSEVGFVSLF